MDSQTAYKTLSHDIVLEYIKFSRQLFVSVSQEIICLALRLMRGARRF